MVRFFQDIISQTFIPEIDLFASKLNAKTAKFVSWNLQPGAVAIDAFSLSWANINCYAFPLKHLGLVVDSLFLILFVLH